MTAGVQDREAQPALGATNGAASRARDATRELIPALARLDLRLEHAAACVPVVYGENTGADRYRGLYISDADVERLLARAPGDPAFVAHDSAAWDASGGSGAAVAHDSRLAWLRDAFELTPFDLDVVLLALAPELDLRYERLYAYLQDDVTRRRPSVDLALNLFCATAADRIARRGRLGADAPLISSRLVELTGEGAAASLLSRTIVLDPQILRFLLGDDGLDPRLSAYCALLGADDSDDSLTADDSSIDTLVSMVDAAYARGESRALHFVGPRGTGKRRTAATIAARLGGTVAGGRPLLTLDLSRLQELGGGEWERTLALARREAWLRGAMLYVHGSDVVLEREHGARRADVEGMVATFGGTVVLSSTKPWPDLLGGNAVEVAFDLPSFDRQAALWRAMVAQVGGALDAAEAAALASRFRLTPREIAVAVAAAGRRADWRSSLADVSEATDAGELTLDDLLASARTGSSQDLAALATRIQPVHRWQDLVLPDDTLTQLREMCARVALRHAVLEGWGFDRHFSRGKGINALFSGSSGTGKTMAAEVIAAELGLDLFRVELAGVVSKYIGETEKNLDRIFAAAERSNAIVLFDEADALFGKRSEVHDAHDRYANIEISYLLQRMEEYDGIAILATNLRGNLDAAFVRRLAFTVHFPFPDDASRARIWRAVWPAEVPLAGDLDFALLAGRFAMSGGNIRNVALSAAFLAAHEGSQVTMRHILAATRREYQKLGKTLDASDTGTPEPPPRGR